MLQQGAEEMAQQLSLLLLPFRGPKFRPKFTSQHPCLVAYIHQKEEQGFQHRLVASAWDSGVHAHTPTPKTDEDTAGNRKD